MEVVAVLVGVDDAEPRLLLSVVLHPPTTTASRTMDQCKVLLECNLLGEFSPLFFDLSTLNVKWDR